MSEHLPECAPRISNWGEDCICRYLQACEQRVRQETFDADWSEMGQLAAVHLFRRQAFLAGLNAARAAVERVPDWDGFDGVTGTYRATDKDMALAAIDALRGES